MSSIQQVRRVPAPPDPGRVETGAVRFGDDWPGVFIRGDDAIGYASALRRAVEKVAEAHNRSAEMAGLANLADLVELLGCVG